MKFHQKIYFIPKIENDYRQTRGQIEEWKLVYSPQNDIFEDLLTPVMTFLNLDGLHAVNGTKELEYAMYHKKFVAGIEFDHHWVHLF